MAAEDLLKRYMSGESTEPGRSISVFLSALDVCVSSVTIMLPGVAVELSRNLSPCTRSAHRFTVGITTLTVVVRQRLADTLVVMGAVSHFAS